MIGDAKEPTVGPSYDEHSGNPESGPTIVKAGHVNVTQKG